jgi:hypothetical protein
MPRARGSAAARCRTAADPGQSLVLRARDRGGDAPAAGLRRDGIGAAADHQRRHRDRAQILEDVGLAEQPAGLGIAVGPELRHHGADMGDRVGRRVGRQQVARALVGQAGRAEQRHLAQPRADARRALVLGRLAVAGSRRAQDQAQHALVMAGAQRRRHDGAERMAEQDEALEAERVGQPERGSRVVGGARRRVGQPVRLAVAGRVPGDHAQLGRQAGELSQPRAGARADAVQQQQRRSRAGLAIGQAPPADFGMAQRRQRGRSVLGARAHARLILASG